MVKKITPFVLICTLVVSACSDHPSAGVAKKDSTIHRADTLKKDSTLASESGDAISPLGREVLSGLDQRILSFVPAGYSVIDTCSGDLNLDQYGDMLVVLKENDEATKAKDVEGETIKRPMLVLLGQPDGTYNQVARNDNAVYCVSCGGVMGDPYQQLAIKQGYFSVEHYGGSAWRWTRVITFKYSPADSTWLLHKDGGESYHTSDPDKVTQKVRTVKDFGKVPFTAFDIYKDQ
ncbi:hypothetical protein [Paraflavitalea sp. CAU 1676]|uniref:hypothetical protein n=1 Tax=Paraflavitalea sp. CAU 1676 TaxID=3032598 RepID=UPI0023DAD664|nr:hypothetical protein [Paraflavitalea sp. CAU 1676]MDF2192867.1 hypothetical protein [Paraflavitalea sp. CAU 1676]